MCERVCVQEEQKEREAKSHTQQKLPHLLHSVANLANCKF